MIYCNNIKYQIKKNKVVDKNITLDSIFKQIENHTTINYFQIKSKSRKREIVEARYIAIHLINKYQMNTLVNLGKIINRDHSTIIYALKASQDLYKYNFDFRNKLISIECSVIAQ